MLSAMRNRDGSPNWVVRVLALVVALMVAGPWIVALLLRGLDKLLSVV